MMDFPVWQVPALGGGLLIILVAVLHVFVAHFAVGGGLFLVLAEGRARRLHSRPLLDYLRRYAKFFLLLTMVFGALSGVGIWFTIAVLAPQATLVLVRTFVWAWATEWTFFAGEIAALLVYAYGFDRLAPDRHRLVGWCYFLFAWLSLFTVNGILGFMLTPGAWPATRDFWDGFFNPTFWPSLALRTAMALLLAGLFGAAAALRFHHVPVREEMVRSAVRWVVAAAPALLLAGWWYVAVLPGPVRDFFLAGSTETAALRGVYPALVVAIAAGSLVLAARLPLAGRRALAGVLLLLGLGLIGSFETLREAARKPWLISGLVWSTDLRPDRFAPHDAPFLPRTRFASVQEVTDDNRLAAGRELFAAQCLACHSLGGPVRDIRRYTGHIGAEGLAAYLTGQGRLFTQMPPFLGSPAERQALAAYLARDVNHRPPENPAPAAVEPATVDIPAFDAATATHLLLAWNSLGVVAMAGCDGSFSLAVPGNTLTALLIKRDVMPEVVADGAALAYQAPEGFKHPSARSDFWKYAASLVGRDLAPDVSITGLGPDGLMTARDNLFAAEGVPVTPYPEAGGIDPYPVFTITARDAKTGAVLAATRAVAPAATEMRCFTCHGGSLAVDGQTGVAPDTAKSILAVHDKRNGTDLAARASSGRPAACQSCHPDAGPNAGPAGPGNPALLSLSAAVHGFHAAYLAGSDAAACAKCHPVAPTGVTQAQRDNHAAAGIGCPRCHGCIEDHAIALLRHEQAAGKTAADWLLRPLTPRGAPDAAAVHPRAAWVQEPDCLTCHQDFARSAKDASAFNAWTPNAAGLFRNRREATGNVPCAACHGSPHATFVAVNDYGLDMNNLAPLQYMGAPGVIGSVQRCDVCHTVPMEGGEAHHPNMVK